MQPLKPLFCLPLIVPTSTKLVNKNNRLHLSCVRKKAEGGGVIIQLFVPVFGLLVVGLSARRTAMIRELSAAQRAPLIGLVVISLGGLQVYSAPLWASWVLISLTAFLLKVVPLFLDRRNRDFSLENALFVLDHMILSMKGGRSLRWSLKHANQSVAEPKMSQLLHRLGERLEHSAGAENSGGLFSEILKELRELEARGRRSIESLESFRAELRTRADFRRRSGQLTLQTRLQAGLAAILYLPLVFIQWRAGNLWCPRTLISLGLFAAAQVIIQMTYRSFRWSV